MTRACYAYPDGNEWSREGPTGRPCPVCKGNGYLGGEDEDDEQNAQEEAAEDDGSAPVQGRHGA